MRESAKSNPGGVSLHHGGSGFAKEGRINLNLPRRRALLQPLDLCVPLERESFRIRREIRVIRSDCFRNDF